MVLAMAKDNDTKSLLKLLKHYEMMLGYVANQAEGCINARERSGLKKMSTPEKRRLFVEQSRKMLNGYLLADDDCEV
tara:strand:+ start:945 stop:1175 length:231 start_codon:yes stop_codon:yes gene_type:complete